MSGDIATLSLMRLLILLTLLMSSPLSAQSLNITTGEFLPDYSEKYKHHGLTPHIVSEALAEGGLNSSWQFVPWGRAFVMAYEGFSDATCCWAKTAERARLFNISAPIQTRTYVFFHRKDFNFDWDTFDDLAGMYVGASIGYFYGSEFTKLEESQQLKVQRVATDKLNLKLLHAKRIEIFPVPLETGYSIINNLFGPEEAKLFTHHPKPMYTYQNHLLVSRHHTNGPQIIERFNQGLKRIKQDGRYERFHMEAQRGDYLPATKSVQTERESP